MPAGPYTWLAFTGFAVAFGMKAAMFPLHLWMADAYGTAPVPAVTLSSMVMLKTGAYGLIRVYYNVLGTDMLKSHGWQEAILVLSVISVLYGSTCAFAERDLMPPGLLRGGAAGLYPAWCVAFNP